MRGFKEDFDAWRASLTPEEQKLVQSQAEGEFNKKFRKSDDFGKDLPEEKVKSFGKVLSKFFDSEAADYKKEMEAKKPSGGGLLEKAGDKVLDFSLKHSIVEVNRDADRRYRYATMKNFEYSAKGEGFPKSSPLMEIWGFQNNDTRSHEANVQVLEFLKSAAADPEFPEEWKEAADTAVKKGIPAMGEKFEVSLPQVVVNQYHLINAWMRNGVEDMRKTKTEAEVKEFIENTAPKISAEMVAHINSQYFSARAEVEKDVKTMKDFYLNQKEMPGKTKADILKEIWAQLPSVVDKPVPPLDEEMLAELAEEPAVIESEFRHTWGTADKLYKSEAIDAFGMKYLLGVYETKEEAQKAFDAWNVEYEQARADMKVEMQEWSKQENARLDKDPSGRERIKQVLEEARR